MGKLGSREAPTSSSKGAVAQAELVLSHTGLVGPSTISLLFGAAQYPGLWYTTWLAAPCRLISWPCDCPASGNISQRIPIPQQAADPEGMEKHAGQPGGPWLSIPCW